MIFQLSDKEIHGDHINDPFHYFRMLVRTTYFILILVSIQQIVQSKNLNYAWLLNTTDSCECGRPREEATIRIVHGEVAPEHVYPWMVAILNNGKIHCGGTLINDRYVLTAGHCLNWSNKEDLSVVLGMYDRVLMETEQKGAEEVAIEKMFVHEDFSSDYLHDSDDIGLIKLQKPVVFKDDVSTICLPTKDVDLAQKRALVAGWGRTSQNGSPSRLLRQAYLRIMTNQECQKINALGEHVTDSMLCAYDYKTDACQGDSGGPLILEGTSRQEQIGVVSWGIGCAKPGMPGVYTRLSKYVEWIAAHTRDAIYCKDSTRT